MTDKLPAIVTDLSDTNSHQKEDPTLIPTPSDHTKVDIDLLSPHNDPSNPFAYIPTQLSSLMDPKNLQLLASLGGLEGVAKGLHADIHQGLSPAANIDSAVSMSSPEAHPFEPSNNFDKRTAIFGTNKLPEAKAKNIFQLMLLAFRDKTLILLAVAAVVSLAIGLYEDIAVPEYDSQGNKIPGVKWVEGVAIIVAITIVVLAGSINDFQKERQFRKLNAKKEDRQIKVTRQGEICMVSVHDIVVGDVIHLEPGDIVAADGIFIQGHNLRCDESAATGESDAVRKLPWEACWRMTYGEQPGDDGNNDEKKQERQPEQPTKDNFLAPPSPTQYNRNSKDNLSVASTAAGSDVAGKPVHIEHAHRSVPDPFIISGSKVLEGMATYLVTCVGVNSYHGRTMMALRTEDEMTPLQTKLNGLAGMIAKLGSGAAVVMLIALLIRYFVGFRYGVPTDGAHIAADVMSILILVVTVIVVAVPEGLPLAVTLALAYATQRMLKDNNLVRVLASCETMGNATTVCSDKTGTLTENKMTVVAGTIGHDLKVQREVSEEETDKSIVPMTAMTKSVPKSILGLIHEAIAINSSAFEGKDDNGNNTIVGNKTETAMLNFCMETGSEHFETLRERYPVEHLFPFSSERKAMATVVRVPEASSSLYRLHLKGASEILVDLCSHVVSCSENDSLTTLPLTETGRTKIQDTINAYATRGLRTIAIAYQDLKQWPPSAAATTDAEEVSYEDLVKNKDLTLLAIVGIEDPLRPGVKDAVKACQNAGVVVRMVTGDNVMTAKSIAEQCGIYTEGGIVMEGPKFRHLSPSEMDAIIPNLQVLARSSPEDKRILVGRLKQMGETVAVTGDGTNDGPALKLADVGFSMGIAGTEVAKEASSIILMDDNFASIVKAISWGRCVNDAVRKFLEFQLTVNVTAVVLTFISGVASESQKSVLTAVQLLWVNLIMDTLAALALATDPPTQELLQRGPEPKSAPLISIPMWKMIIGQSIFQIVVTFVLLYGRILDYDSEDVVLQTIVFNTFVFCQIFNEINCRRIDKKYNVFFNILANKFFICIFFGCVALQAIIVNFGGVAFQVTPIDGPSWALAIVVGMFSLPVGALVRTIPDSIVIALVDKVGKPFKVIGRSLGKLCFWRKRNDESDQ